MKKYMKINREGQREDRSGKNRDCLKLIQNKFQYGQEEAYQKVRKKDHRSLSVCKRHRQKKEEEY